MSDSSVISALIAKLGHGLEEIRERALNTLISKLEYGLISDDDLAVRKELFSKLLDWFYLKPCVEKEKVLKLILQLVKIAWERDSLMILEAPLAITRLYEIQSDLEAPLKSYIDQIIAEITREREDRAKANGLKESETTNFSQPKEQRQPVAVQGTGFYSLVYPVNVASAESLLNIFPHLLLPWQPLVTTDRHVLKAVEESLTEASELVLLLHSCYFFTDVLLQDFPSEVFLQRPAIVKVFIELLESSQTAANNALYSATNKCLLKVSEALLVRVRYYCDPCTSNLKQEMCTSREVAVSSTTFGSARTLDSGDYLQNNSTVTTKRGRGIGRNEEIFRIEDQERNNRSQSDVPPLHMPISYGPVVSAKVMTVDKESDPESTLPLCLLCHDAVSHAGSLSCVKPGCTLIAHIICLAKHFSQPGQLLPVEGNCPACKSSMLWGDLVRKKKGCYSNLTAGPGPVSIIDSP